MKRNRSINIGVITRPASGSTYTESIHKFVSILKPSADSVTLLSGPEVADASELPDENLIKVERRNYSGFTPLDYLLLQVEIALNILLARDEFDLLYFHKGAMAFVLPVVVSRLAGIDTCVIKIGAFSNQRSQLKNPKFSIKLLSRLQYWSFRLADAAVVFTQSEQSTVPNETVFIAYSEYCDFDKFDIRTDFQERRIDIGFLGRFNKVKGVSAFAKASQELTNRFPDIRIRLLGDGPLFESIEKKIGDNPQIELAGWVERENIASELNDIRILVVPSEAEGLPTTVLEAMGCGVVVVATPVGSLPDIIEDGDTGFLIDGNSSKSIVQAVSNIQERTDLQEIAMNGREFVKSKYSLNTTQQDFAQISIELLK